MSGEVLLNPSKLTDFVNAFSKSTFGDNIGVDQLFTLGQSMQGVEAGRVTFITVPTVGEANDDGNEDLRADDTNALFEAIRQDTPLPGETPASSGSRRQQPGSSSCEQQGPVDPKTIKIQVLNGGNETGGIAGDTADELAEHGFQIVRGGRRAGERRQATVIKYAKEPRGRRRRRCRRPCRARSWSRTRRWRARSMLIIGPGFDGKVGRRRRQGKPDRSCPTTCRRSTRATFPAPRRRCRWSPRVHVGFIRRCGCASRTRPVGCRHA